MGILIFKVNVCVGILSYRGKLKKANGVGKLHKVNVCVGKLQKENVRVDRLYTEMSVWTEMWTGYTRLKCPRGQVIQG